MGDDLDGLLKPVTEPQSQSRTVDANFVNRAAKAHLLTQPIRAGASIPGTGLGPFDPARQDRLRPNGKTAVSTNPHARKIWSCCATAVSVISTGVAS